MVYVNGFPEMVISAPPIEINAQFKKALEVMENTAKNVFITGKAGTGKSTLLGYFRNITTKKIVVLAPTGVAALNVKGETIHSFFRFKPDITFEKIKKLKGKRARIYQEIDTIVIDEISMVRADLLDCVDRFLRLNADDAKKPFGGLQMVFIGDLYQLPPVITAKEKPLFTSRYPSAYFFDADVFKELSLEFIELDKVYRQKDEAFIRILNAIRNNSVTDEDLGILNSRLNAGFAAKGKSSYTVYLCPTNKIASEINQRQLDTLKTKVYVFAAKIEGDFKEYAYPTENIMHLGIGAQVMLLNNDAKGRWVNGSLGKISDIQYDDEKENEAVFVRLAGGNIEKVLPFTWEIFHFSFNEGTHAIETEMLGSFTQYPLKLAWAITIHKSQGKTFDRVIIDMDKGAFAHGQTYVALSRCTSLEGITLKRPIKKSDIFMDWRIVRFMTSYQYSLSERDMPFEEKVEVIQEAIKPT